MRFFSKTLDKLKGALKKTAAVLNTDVRTLFIPGRQIDDAFLTEMEEKFLKADMGIRSVEPMVAAERGAREQMIQGWGPADERELHFAASGPTVILVAGINGAGKTTSIAKLA